MNRKGRSLLREMTLDQQQAWLLAHRSELEEFASYVQRYTKSRARRKIRTATDERYEQFLAQAADLINGLDELRSLLGETNP